MITTNCKFCNKEFETYPSHIKNNGGKFCSMRCLYNSRKGTTWHNKPIKKVICKTCKKEFIIYPSRINAKFCSKKCDDIFRKGKHISPKSEFKKGQNLGEKHPNWKGGKCISKGGYIFIYNPTHPFASHHGYVREHRLIVEQQIGRYLLPFEKTHHLNEIKSDNRLCNLMAFTSESAHQRFHNNPNNVKPNEIIFDGRKLL